MKKVCFIIVLLLIFSNFGCVKKPQIDKDSFEFSIIFGTNGTSSYNSKTGELIRTKHSQNSEKYRGTMFLSEQKTDEVIALIQSLDILSYPDKYNPNKSDYYETPNETIILTVTTKDFSKTVTCDTVFFEHKGHNKKAQRFLDAVDAIEKIITETDEWKAFPELDFGFM